MGAFGGIDQLRGEADAIAGLSHTAFENRENVEADRDRANTRSAPPS
jgi:hypothetical protein